MSIIRDIPINDPIHCVYFYYVKFPEAEEQEQGPEIRGYYYFEEADPIRDEIDLRRILKMLGRNAGNKDFAPPPFNARAVPWRRRSYLAVLVDGSNALSDVRDIIINFKGAVEEVSHSFFNARLMEIDMSVDNSGRLINVFHCVNLMRHQSGRDMYDGEREPYHLSFGPAGERRLLDDDDGGTNQGGPIPPLIEYGVSEEWRG